MKIRNYEKTKEITIIIVLVIIIESIFLTFLINNKIYCYEQMTTIVLKDNIVMLVASKKEKELLYKNAKLFLKDKKVKYKIIEDKGVVITRNNKKYYEVLLEFKFDKKYKSNDTITVSLQEEKIKLIKIFKLIWDGD